MATAPRKRNIKSSIKSGPAAQAQAQVKTFRDDLDALQSNVKRLVGDVGSAASLSMQSAQDAVERVEDWGSENIDEARETVRNQPLTACMLSLGAGAILGALLLR